MSSRLRDRPPSPGSEPSSSNGSINEGSKCSQSGTEGGSWCPERLHKRRVEEYSRPRVLSRVRIRPEIQDKFVALAKEKGSTQCELLEAWVLAAVSGGQPVKIPSRGPDPEQGKEAPTTQINNFSSTEVNLFRVVQRRRRILVERPRPGDEQIDTQGSPERCAYCDSKPIILGYTWAERNDQVIIVHELYLCSRHKAEALHQRRLTGYSELQQGP